MKKNLLKLDETFCKGKSTNPRNTALLQFRIILWDMKNVHQFCLNFIGKNEVFHGLLCLYKQEKPKRLRNESTADLRILGWQLRKLYSEPYNPYLQIVSWLDPFDRKLSYAPRPKHNTPWWIVNSKYVMCCQSGLAAYITIYAKEYWYRPIYERPMAQQ